MTNQDEQAFAKARSRKARFDSRALARGPFMLQRTGGKSDGHAQPRQRPWCAITVSAAGTHVHPAIFENLTGLLAAQLTRTGHAHSTASVGGTSLITVHLA
jgi:hypothetical protein